MLPRPDRKIAPSLLATFHHPDPSRNIASAFTDEAKRREAEGLEGFPRMDRVHRIGLMNGLGFGIPEMDDGRNLVQVVAEFRRVGLDRLWEGSCTIRIAKCDRHDDHLIKDIIEVTDEATGVPLAEVPARIEALLWPK